MSIPLRLLRHRATIKRHNPVSETWQDLYTDVPCFIGTFKGYEATLDYKISSVKYDEMIFFNYEFNGSPLEIKQEDEIYAHGKKYIVQKVREAEDWEHHWEIEVERVETLGTTPGA